MHPTDKRIPVTVLTGFLGSGKTTLLNRILSEQHGQRIAVIENEFGEIGIDNELVINADEEIFEMNNGCICCTVRGDLIRILNNLVKRKNQLDLILIENTGLADPAPVAQTFFVDEDVKEKFRLDAIITLVDAKHVWHHIDSSKECPEQIGFADRIILNKTDLVSEADLVKVEKRIQAMNSQARLFRAQNANVPLKELLALSAFDLSEKLSVYPDFLKPELPYEWGGIYSLKAGTHTIRLQAGPDPSMGLALFGISEAGTDSWERAKESAVHAFSAAPTPRDPGASFTPGPQLNELQLNENGGTFTVEIRSPGSYAVFTQHGPDEFGMTLSSGEQVLSPSAMESFAGHHTHDDSVTSVGISEPRPVAPDKLNEWLGILLREKGQDIYRMKGIIHVQGQDCRFVFQGVHMLFDGRLDRPWKQQEQRCSQIVFIGKNLNRAELESGFRSCLA